MYDILHPILLVVAACLLTISDNQEFCKIPLTFDLPINPFQYQRVMDTEPAFLHHAVMALAGHHVDSPTTEDHRRQALQLFREGLDMNSDSNTFYYFLDTIIILFSLDVRLTIALLPPRQS